MAASAGAIRAGRAFVEVFSEDSKLVRGLKSSLQKCQTWGAAVTKAGAGLFSLGSASLGGLVALTKSFSDVGSELGDMSDRTGASVEALSELKFAAEQTGSNLGAVEGGLKKMQKGLSDAAGGGKKAIAAFDKIGLSAQQLAGLSPEDQFSTIAKRIAAIQDPAERTAAAMSIFGKSGTALLPMMQQLDDLKGRAHELGAVMTTDDKEAADAFGDALGELTASIGGVKNAIGVALAPTLTNIVTQLAEGISRVSGWVHENRGLVTGALAAAAGVTVLGAALIAVGATLASVSVIAGAVGTGIAAVWAAVTSPIALVGVAFAGILSQMDEGQAAFQSLKGTAVDAFGGIKKALGAGEFKLAAEIVWASLRLEWEKGIAFLTERWERGKSMIISAWESLGPTLGNVTLDMLGELEKQFVKFFDVITNPQRLMKIASSGLANPTDFSPEAQRKLAAIDMGKAARNIGTDMGLSMNDRRRQAELDKVIAENEKAVADRNRTFRDLLDRANNLPQSERGGDPSKPRPVRPTMPNLQQDLPKWEAKGSSVGTFSAAAAGMLQGTSVMVKLASATEKTSKNTKDTADNTKRLADAAEDEEDDGETWE